MLLLLQKCLSAPLPQVTLLLRTNAPLLFMGVHIEKVSPVYCWCFKWRSHALVLAYIYVSIVCVSA